MVEGKEMMVAGGWRENNLVMNCMCGMSKRGIKGDSGKFYLWLPFNLLPI